jgi:2-iminoacetate synthase ThiH
MIKISADSSGLDIVAEDIMYRFSFEDPESFRQLSDMLDRLGFDVVWEDTEYPELYFEGDYEN